MLSGLKDIIMKIKDSINGPASIKPSTICAKARWVSEAYGNSRDSAI